MENKEMTPTATKGYEYYRKALVREITNNMFGDEALEIKSVGFRYDENSSFQELLLIQKIKSTHYINITGLNRAQIYKEMSKAIHGKKAENALHVEDLKILNREIEYKKRRICK